MFKSFIGWSGVFKSIFTAQEPVTILFVRARSLLKFGRCFLMNGASNFLNCLASMSTATHCVNLQVLAKLSTSGSCWFSIISAISSGACRTAARSISSPHSLYKLTVCDCSALLSNQVCHYDPGVLHGLLRGVVCSCLSYRRMSFQCTFFVIIIQFKLQPARTSLLFPRILQCLMTIVHVRFILALTVQMVSFLWQYNVSPPYPLGTFCSLSDFFLMSIMSTVSVQRL